MYYVPAFSATHEMLIITICCLLEKPKQKKMLKMSVQVFKVVKNCILSPEKV